MSDPNSYTLTGNLVADPELRFTPSGKAVTNMTIAHTPRQFDSASKDWKDGETLFMKSAIWGSGAENTAETLTKGMRVIATGKLQSRAWETKEGEKRSAVEFLIEEIGPSLKYANAKVNRTQRGETQNRGGGSGQWTQPQGGAQDDPWATPKANADGWGTQQDDGPPF